MKKYTILMMIIYILSFSINLIPSIKHPDLNLTLMNLLVSLLFMIATVLWVKAAADSKWLKFLKSIMAIGTLSGLFIFIMSLVQHITIEYLILDAISGIQFPLYVLFVAPLFGLNFILNIDFGMFSLIMSLYYMALLLYLHRPLE
ncbi:hypothetical protein EZV73_15105 [Acidaminobacter sp. JC074]|uniref:hypothetical protein n=1 Tax=Acidaminobacter sp. JC074 TaxID=2530199 RepID=UPI001F0FD397|nr:hypothetical protein [Acidaminobacter sp. JC074]MCH4888922.1 hypothetical protein [Acidaminobacter sp. JC074]